MPDAVLNTTLNNNNRPPPTIPWLFLLVYLLLLIVFPPLAQHLQSRQAKHLCDRRPAHASRGEARRGKALFSRLSRPTLATTRPSKLISSVNHRTAPLLFALAPASRSLCRPEPPSLSAAGAVSVASHPHQLSAARSGKRDRRAIFAPLSTRPQKSSARPLSLSLPPCPCATEAEGVRARTAQTQDRRARQAAGLPGVTVTSWSLTGRHIVSGVLPSAPLSWAILSLGAHLRRQPRCITTTRPKRRPLPPTGFLGLGSGCLYTPSVQTAHHHHRPCGASFLPSPYLLLFGRSTVILSLVSA